MPRAQLAARRSRATRSAARPPFSRSTGKAPIKKKNLSNGETKSCFLAIHWILRGTAIETNTGSAYRRWLAATIRGPSFGTFSAPKAVKPNRSHPRASMKRLKVRYLGDIPRETPFFSLSASTLWGAFQGVLALVGEHDHTRDDPLQREVCGVEDHGVGGGL